MTATQTRNAFLHFQRVGQTVEQYDIVVNPDYTLGESFHSFSVNGFDPNGLTGGTLRRVNIYLGIHGTFEYDFENLQHVPVHVYIGTWYFQGVPATPQSRSTFDVYYDNSGTLTHCAGAVHYWPDEQVDVAASLYTGTPNFTGPDAYIYSHSCNDNMALALSITDPTQLALWTPQVVQLQYYPSHVRYVHPPFTIDNAAVQTNCRMDIEFNYSIP